MKNDLLKIYIMFAKLVGFFNTTLQTTFIVLKLLKLIDWSWQWVLSPLWISLAVAVPGLLYAWFQYYRRVISSP
jgi:hypothetical protein